MDVYMFYEFFLSDAIWSVCVCVCVLCVKGNYSLFSDTCIHRFIPLEAMYVRM